MAITYPVSAPQSTIGLESIQISADNVTAVSTSPFTYQQQVYSYPGGERWRASVKIPRVLSDKGNPWTSFLTSLRGQYGSFKLIIPNQPTPAGGATSLSVSGSAGDRTITISSISGTMNAGDFFSLNSSLSNGAFTELYQCLETTSGGTMEIWPALRTGTGGSAVINDPFGHFRLSAPASTWGIDSNSSFDISFDAVEVVSS